MEIINIDVAAFLLGGIVVYRKAATHKELAVIIHHLEIRSYFLP